MIELPLRVFVATSSEPAGAAVTPRPRLYFLILVQQSVQQCGCKTAIRRGSCVSERAKALGSCTVRTHGSLLRRAWSVGRVVCQCFRREDDFYVPSLSRTHRSYRTRAATRAAVGAWRSGRPCSSVCQNARELTVSWSV